MDIYLTVLRLFHVFSGVFWVGYALLFFFFIEPTSKRIAPEGPRFINHLMKQGRLAIWIPISAGTTILSGILLYAKESNGFQISWIMSTAGIQFTIGAAASTFAFLIGLFLIGPAVNRLSTLGQEMNKTGKPTAVQKNELGNLQRTIAKAGKINLILLIATLALMVIAPEFTK